MNNFMSRWVNRMLTKAAASVVSYSLQDQSFGKKLINMMGRPTYTGKSVDETSAMQIATVWSCVRIISETIGSLPWAIYERDGKGNSTKVDHDLGYVLTQSPNSDMTPVEFKEAKGQNLALQGNAYSFREARNDGSTSSLYPIPTPLVLPEINKDSGEVQYKVLERGKWETYPREKIWHVKGFGQNGLVGLSPISYAAQSMGLALASEEFQARFFAHGAAPSWLISIPNWLKEDQREIARQNIQQLWGGLDNAHHAKLLEGGMTATPGTMPLADAQFLELRGLTVEEICRIFRIQPHLVAKLDRSTNNNIEQQALEFVMFTMQPYLTRIESSAGRWLFKPGENKRFFLRFNVEGLLRADAAARSELYSKYVQNGIMNRNEVRALENMNHVDGLDEYTAQVNLTPVEMLAALAQKQAEAKQTPPQPAVAA
jgi:HK97 family phage portal protein